MSITKITYTTPAHGAGSANPTFVEGSTTVDGENTLLIADMTLRDLLEQLLVETKKTNVLLEELL